MKNTTSLNLKKFKKKYDEDGFVLIKNHLMLQECVEKIEVLFQVFNQIKDKDK